MGCHLGSGRMFHAVRRRHHHAPPPPPPSPSAVCLSPPPPPPFHPLQVEKYRMTDEDYDSRPGTLRAFKREQLAKDPTFKFFPKKAAEDTEVCVCAPRAAAVRCVCPRPACVCSVRCIGMCARGPPVQLQPLSRVHAVVY